VFVVCVICFAPKELPEGNHRIVGFVTALAAAFLAFFFTGKLDLQGRLGQLGNLAVEAGGGFALFVLLL